MDGGDGQRDMNGVTRTRHASLFISFLSFLLFPGFLSQSLVSFLSSHQQLSDLAVSLATLAGRDDTDVFIYLFSVHP